VALRVLYLMFVRVAGWMALLARPAASKDARLLGASTRGAPQESGVPTPKRQSEDTDVASSTPHIVRNNGGTRPSSFEATGRSDGGSNDYRDPDGCPNSQVEVSGSSDDHPDNKREQRQRGKNCNEYQRENSIRRSHARSDRPYKDGAAIRTRVNPHVEPHGVLPAIVPEHIWEQPDADPRRLHGAVEQRIWQGGGARVQVPPVFASGCHLR
jgi:hypothetical protein